MSGPLSRTPDEGNTAQSCEVRRNVTLRHELGPHPAQAFAHTLCAGKGKKGWHTCSNEEARARPSSTCRVQAFACQM